MNTLYDFVILLSGNSYICSVDKDGIKALESALVEALNHPNKTVSLRDGNRSAQLRPDAIMGWYYKPHEKSTQEKMYEVIKNTVEPPGDSWKTGE